MGRELVRLNGGRQPLSGSALAGALALALVPVVAALSSSGNIGEPR